MTSSLPALSLASGGRKAGFAGIFRAFGDIDISLSLRLLLAGWLSLGALGLSAHGQATAKVTVNLDKEVNIITSTSLGTPAKLYVGESFNAETGQYLKAAGLSTVIYPGSNADLYHWSTRSTAKYKGAEPAYAPPETNFGAVAQVADKAGTALIVVNYGSNADGTGGGEPAEAAAWVAYANGDPASAQAIGKDSTGHDWQTVGYWATLRTQAALPTDDGLNFLRISRPSPLKIRLWQVGSQVYNNGFYGGDHTGEPDLHAPSPNAVKDFSKLRKQPNLAPGYYGDRIVEFSKAMKAVDPTIQIGATMVTPPDGQKWAPDWNSGILKKACKDLDFVTLEWTVGNTLAPDYKTLDENDVLTSARGQLNGLLSGILYDDKTSCPQGHTPKIGFNPAGVITWAKVEHPIALGLWAADTYALLVETGGVNITWPDMYSDAMISTDRKKFGAVYYGLQMFHIVAHAPGDVLVDAASNNAKLAVHATKRRDGITALMLVNKDSTAPVTVRVSVTGGTVGAKGLRFDYGIDQQKAGTALVRSDIKDLGQEFTVTVPAYTITDVLIGK